MPGCAWVGAISLHAEILVPVESGRTVVCRIQRDVIAHVIFRSVADLGSKLRKYIRAYSKSAERLRAPEAESQIGATMKSGFQTRDAGMTLAQVELVRRRSDA
jgi:hypothetical protein